MSAPTVPLGRFTVLDLTRVRSGPTCVRQLGDWGARVIKIEAPVAVDKSGGMGGARHGPDFQNIQRNKRSLTLNLKSADGVKAFMRLVEQADVLVENYRPDVKHRLGIDYETLKAVNPRLVYASISGFGQTGPYAGRPGFDQIAQGMSGLMSITGAAGEGPMRAGIPIADLTAGMYAAMGILIALLERETSGHGQWVHTSLLEAQLNMLDFQASRYLMKGEVAGQAGNNHPTSIPTGVYPTQDGHINIAASGDHMWTRLCQVLGAENLSAHPDYATAELRSTNRDSLNEQLCEKTRAYTSDDAVTRLNEAGVPCGRINTIDEAFNDEQVKTLKIRQPVDHPTLGNYDIVGQAVNLSRAKPMPFRAAPEQGEHTDEILTEFGFSSDEIDTLRSQDAI